MQKTNLIFYPSPGLDSRGNLFVERFLNILCEKYNVVGMEEISNDIKKIRDTEAFIINWGEYNCDARFKRHVLLYKALGVKICWMFHDRIPHDCKDPQQIKDVRWMADHSSYIVLLSHSSIKYLPNRKRNEKKCVYMPHVHYVGAYPVCKMDLRKKYGIGKKEFMFSFLCSLKPYKNIETVIQAFQELDLKDARLLVAGDVKNGRYVNALRELIGKDERIILETGYISNGDMEAYLKGSDVMVLPYSKRSSMNSGALMMAFSYGRTAIVSKIAMAEDLENENIAFIYDYADESENLEQLKAEMLKPRFRS